MSAPVIIERAGRVAPLGIRFHDAVTDTMVSDLEVYASPADQPTRRVRAIRNTSGVYGWVELPGVRGKFGLGDDAYWAAQPPALPFVIDVTDRRDRFLPFALTVPAPTRRIWEWTCDPSESPPSALGAVPLHSSPGRNPPAVTVAIRAELRDATTDAPAAWAIVEARVAGKRIGRGMTDARGVMLLLAHYPEPMPLPLGAALASPPGAVHAPLWEQTWPVDLDVFYQGLSPAAPPELCAAMLQPPAIAWADDAQSTALGTLTLRYGEALDVKSMGGRSGAEGVLLVTRAGSPP